MASFVLQFVPLGEKVITCLDTDGYRILSDRSLVVGGVVRADATLGTGDFCGIAQVTVVGIAADNPVVVVVREVECTDKHFALHFVIGFACTFLVVRLRVVHRVAVIAAQAHAQAFDGIVVHTGGNGILVGNLEFEG